MKRLTLSLVAAVLICASSASSEPTMLAPADTVLTKAEQEELAFAMQPEAWFAARLKGHREQVDGQRLNAKIQFMLERGRTGAPTETAEAVLKTFATPEQRAVIRAAADRRWTIRTQVSPDMASVEERRIPGRGGEIQVRIYRPVTDQEQALPVLVYYHGGGFVFSSVKAVDRMVRLMANEAKVVVVSVDYRLAPEHPFPAAHDDAEDAFLWARAHAGEIGGDARRIAVGGDSAGGHLAVITSMRQAQAGRPGPLYQLLYYPAVSVGEMDRSYELFDEGYGLDRGFIEAVTKLTFVDPSPLRTPAAAPLQAPSLRGMPATILVTAGYDPLRDQGRRLAGRLEADGVSVIQLNYGSLTHSFLNWSGVIEDAEQAARQTAAVFGTAIRSRDTTPSAR